MDKIKKEHIYVIDLLRFVSAFSVLFYHYCFAGYNKSIQLIRYPFFENISKYGYIGVQIFFIISGFSIAMNIENKTPMDFIKSRIIRLFPAYWFCVLFTGLTVILFGEPKFSNNLYNITDNIPMIHMFYGVNNIDGVYWTLLLEIRFYIIIGLLLIFRKNKKTIISTNFLVIWTLISLFTIMVKKLFNNDIDNYTFNFIINKFYDYFIVSYSHYFILGILFYKIYSYGKSIINLILIIINILISFYQEYLIKLSKEIYHNDKFSIIVINVIIVSIIILMFLIVNYKFIFLERYNKIFISIGKLTYPLYLLHQYVGHIMINKLTLYVNKYISLTFTILIMLLISYFVVKIIEKYVQRFLRQKL